MVISSKALHNHTRGENVTQRWRPHLLPRICYGVKFMRRVLAIFALTAPLVAQEVLSLRQAVDLALRSNPLVAAADAGEKEAEARIQQARSRYMPRAHFSESLQRGNNPVFVFTSLLTQHQFTEGNFAIGSLNRPDALNNYQSRLTVEQVLFDARQTSRGVEAARFARQLTSEDTRRSQSDVVLRVLQTYFAAVLAEKNLEVANQSVESAQADVARAVSIYHSGRSTQADVLALRVHLAAMREEQIRTSNDLAVTRAALNDALGVSLDRTFELTTPLVSSVAEPEASLEEYRRMAAERRPEMRQAELAQRLAHTQQQIAGAAYWPEVVFQGIVEADRQNFYNKGGVYWFTAVSLRWSIWNGGETKAQVQQAHFAETRAAALRRRSDSAVHLEVRKAYLDVKAAAQRVETASAASAEAEEAHRIIQNRHQSGLTTVTELLRSETALAAARTRHLMAVYDHRVAAAALEYAAGTLTANSEVVN
jgi:outer membrane protein